MSSSRSAASTTIRRLATAIERPPSTSTSSSHTPTLPPTARARGQGRYGTIRSNWLRREVQEIFDGPLMETVFKAAEVHRMHHDPSRIQLCTLMNIKSESVALVPFVAQLHLNLTTPLYSSNSHSRWMPRRLLLLLPINPPQRNTNQSHPPSKTRPCHPSRPPS